MPELRSINIRPGVSILSVLRHLNYRPWFAMAEFVDNAIESATLRQRDLRHVDGTRYRLHVDIETNSTDGGHIRIADNAGGISEFEYARAFRPAEIPPDRSGLAEFGMGMKSAACWFAPHWTVRTTALGESVERTVHFDIEKIVRDDLEELDVNLTKTVPNAHYTEIILRDLYKAPQTNTLKKIREHLASIYRIFIRDGQLELRLDGELLTYDDPRVLVAPYYKATTAPPKQWRKEIDFDFGLGLNAHGFAAIRETASTSGAGFALFRRNRLIQGSADEGYRPEHVFGKPNSYRYQRIFGELHLEGFEVSHTKDGFKWDEHEEVFLELLKEELDAQPLPLLEQAEEHRVRVLKKDLERGAQRATERTAEVIRQEVPPVLEHQLQSAPDAQAPPETLATAVFASTREIDVELRGKPWRIVLELSADPSVSDWITVGDKLSVVPEKSSGMPRRTITVRLALVHPFMERFAGASQEEIEPLLRVAAAIALAEVTARESGIKLAGTFRKNINELLRDAFSKP
jgi:hypothetical protein